MKLQHKLAVAMTALAISTSANAALSFDLRHEIKDSNATNDDNAEHASRFKFGDTFKLNDKWGANLSLETKFKSDDPEDFMKDIYVNEMEVDMGLTYNLGGGWLLKPGMPINVGFDEPNNNGGQHLYRKKTTYKPQVRIQHTAEFDGLKWKNALRYRHEFTDYRNNQGGDKTYNSQGVQTGVDTNQQTIKITLTGQMSFNAAKKVYFAWESNYVKSLEGVKKGLANDEDYDFDAGIFLGYQLGNWRPYVEAWNIKGDDAVSNRRGNKYRIGLHYKW